MIQVTVRGKGAAVLNHKPTKVLQLSRCNAVASRKLLQASEIKQNWSARARVGAVLASHRRSLSTVRRSRNRRGSAFAIRTPPRSSSGRRWKRQVGRAVGVREHAGWRKCEEEESGSCNPSAPLSRYRRSATAVDASRIKHVHGRGAEGPAAPPPPPPLLARTLRPPRSFPRARPVGVRIRRAHLPGCFGVVV